MSNAQTKNYLEHRRQGLYEKLDELRRQYEGVQLEIRVIDECMQELGPVRKQGAG